MDTLTRLKDWNLLMIDDDEEDYIIVRDMLSTAIPKKYTLTWADSYQAGQTALRDCAYDAVLVDYDMGACNGLDLIREALAGDCSIPFILFTGRGTLEVDLDALASGAALYLPKSDATPALLERSIRYAIEIKQKGEALRQANEQLAEVNRQLTHELEQRQRAEQAARASENRFEASIESLLDGFSILSAVRAPGVDGQPGPIIDFAYEYINQKGAEFLGSSPAEIIGQSRSARKPIFASERAFELAIEVVETGQPVAFEDVSYEPGENAIQYLSSAHVVRMTRLDDGLVISRHDITERKRAEQNLRDAHSQLATRQLELTQALEAVANTNIEIAEINDDLLRQQADLSKSQQRNADILISLEDAMLGIDRRWNLTYVNQRAAEYMQTPANALIGKNLWEISPGLIGTPIEKCYRQVMDEGKPVTLETEGLLNDHWYDVRVFPSSEGITAYWVDITHRKQIEDQLALHAGRLSDFLESTEDAFFAVNREWQFVFANQRLCDLVHSPLETLVTQTVWQVLPGWVGTPVEENFQQAMQTRVPIHAPWDNPDDLRAYELYIYPSREGLIVFASDQTEEKRVQQALRESEERLRMLMESSPDLIWSSTPGGAADYVNNAWVEYTGLTLEQINQQGWKGLNHPDDSQRLAKGWADAARRGVPYESEFRYRKYDGTFRWFWGRSVPVKDANGQVIKWVGFTRDIHARRLAEKARNESEQTLRSLFNSDAILAAIVSIDDNDIGFVACNQKLAALYDSTPDEMLHKGASELGIPPEYFQTWRSMARQVMETGLPVNQEFRIVFNNQAHWYYMTISLVQLEPTDHPRFAFIAIDISEQKEAEEALLDKERKFRVALSATPLLVYTCDTQQRYTWVANPLRSFKEQDALGKRDDEIIGPEASAELVAAKQEALDTGRGFVREVKVAYPTGTGYFILTCEPIIDEAGRVSGLTCAALDISEQRKLQLEHLTASTRMEIQSRLSEYREKERQVIARDLHDGPIQTLVATLFNLQAAKESIDDPLVQIEFAQIRQSLQDAVRELREVVNELRPPSLIRFGLGKTLTLYMDDFREKNPHLQVETEIADDERLIPEHTRLALFRICQEALTNVIRHAQANQVWVRLALQDRQVSLTVRDNGLGFPIDNSLVDLTRAGHYGLAGMKERAEAIESRLVIKSAPGQGTQISITLDLNKRVN